MSKPTIAYLLPCPSCGAASGERCVNLRNGRQIGRSHIRRTPIAPCGTPGGYQRHKKAGEPACPECLDANRRFMAEYRRANPEKRQSAIAGLRARHEATKRLIQRHEDEFRSLLRECAEVVS